MMEKIEITGFLVGGIFVAVSVIMLVFPPKKINGFYGYRTPRSMKSQPGWNFSQRFSSLRMLETGSTMVFFSLASGFFGLNPVTASVLSMILMFAGLAYLFIRTESALKKKFPN